MSFQKLPKDCIFSRNNGLNCSIRLKDRKRRIHDQVHVGLQDRLEKEIKIRDGAARLLGACTHETQLLEASKTLHTSNARTLVYMSQLQKFKAAEVMEVVLDEPGISDESRACKGRLAISDIRIPLMWKDIFNTSKPKESTRHAVFCLVTVGSEVQDTDLVCVDSCTTDIAFADIIVFENAGYDFKMKIELFACPMSATSVSAPTPQKLISRLSRSVGKEGKRIREHMKENIINGIKSVAPVYTKVASTILMLRDVGNAFKSHDLDQINQSSLSLPLYESVTCRLVAQPKCITDICLSGFLHYLHMVGAAPNWSYLWCEVKAGIMKGWRSPEDSNKEPQLTIDVLPKDVKVNEIEKTRQKRAHSFQVRDLIERHIFAAAKNEDLVKWIRGIRQHKNDHGAWGVACLNDPIQRTPMFIASPSHPHIPSERIFDCGIRNTVVYDQLDADSPLKTHTPPIHCTDLLNYRSTESDHVVTQSVQSVLLENQTTAPWTGFFTGLSSKPAKIIKKTDIQRNNSCDAILQNHSYNLRTLNSSDSGPRNPTISRSEVSTSDDVFFDSEKCTPGRTPKKSPGAECIKKKRRAPISPWGDTAIKSPIGSPPPKPPLPKLPPKQKLKKQLSMSSTSSLDDILEDQSERNPLLRSRGNAARDGSGEDQSCSHCPNQTANLEKESAGSKLCERSWANERNCVIPANVTKSTHCFERSKSLDWDVSLGSNPKHLTVLAESNTIDGLTRTNTLPKSSPSRSRAHKQPQVNNVITEGLPRRSYLSAVESTKTKPVYEAVNIPSYEVSSNGLSIRRLHYDENARVYCQAKPPALPPKKNKSVVAAPVVEPIYAEIDKVKKNEDREAKARKRADVYAKAHSTVITVCKQRMEEEAQKLKGVSQCTE